MQIVTDNKPRDILYAWNLTDEERKEFDYIDFDAVERGEDNPEFIRYLGQVYHLGDTERSIIAGWDAMVTQTFYSGVLFRWANDFESIVCGRYCA